MRLRPRQYIVLILAGLLLTSVLFASTVEANGGTVQVSNQAAGRYQVTVFTSPSPIRVGTVDVSVLVQMPGSSDVVQDATVTVTAQQVGRVGEIATYPATHEQATNKLYYAANVRLSYEGRWRIGAQVAGSQGEGSVSFEVEATREGLLDRPLLVVAVAAVPVVLVLGWLILGGGRSSRAGRQGPDRV